MNQIKKQLSVAIIGSGKIGTDALIKVLASPYLKCGVFIGRRIDSEGVKKAKSLGVMVSLEGAQGLITHQDDYDIVIDATSAQSHKNHASILTKLNKPVIDLTPSKIGVFCVPVISDNPFLTSSNVNMVTCGGQVSVPIAYAIAQLYPEVEYIETVSSIASDSAGIATRHNLDDYISTTESALKHFCHCKNAKAILNLNPALPQVTMKTTVYASLAKANEKTVLQAIEKMLVKMRSYIPGISIAIPPYFDPENRKLAVTVAVQGRGDFLPAYAGNLDVITAAAVNVAEQYALNFLFMAKAS